MLKFKDYINEGGNMTIGGVSAAPIPVTDKTRGEIQSDVHDALNQLHGLFGQQHGGHLFGKDAKALSTGSAYAGSTKQFMDKTIPHSSFVKYKPSVGDIDVQIPMEHKEKLVSTLQPGTQLGNYTVTGSKKHGNEVSTVLQHKSGSHNAQVDFEGVEYKNDEPTEGEQFLHSSHWDDTALGIKGVHHKDLINAVAGKTRKFSITHGLRPRDNDMVPGIKHPKDISRALFGENAQHDNIRSFVGVTDLIKTHIPASEHQAIYDKFKSSAMAKAKRLDSTNALNHLRTALNVKDDVNEAAAEPEHHVSVVPLTGFSPISHMGHAMDLGKKLRGLPGPKHVGISSKADVFSPEERKAILSRQWATEKKDEEPIQHHIAKSAGEVIAKAHDSLPKKGRRVLHLLVGSDRVDFAQKLKTSLLAGKIKEMQGKSFDRIEIHTPTDEKRTHGMSGTAMRTAARDEDLPTFRKHLGPAFPKQEATAIMQRMKKAIDSGTLKVKR